MADDFIGYEYYDLTVSKSAASVYIDGYTNFGWNLDNAREMGKFVGKNRVLIKFKRNRRLPNKDQIIKLQRQFDIKAAEIENLEKSKKTNASIVSYIVGVIGTTLMAASMFAYMENMVVLMIILAVPGFICWLGAYSIYQVVKQKQAIRKEPVINNSYEDLYDIANQAYKVMKKKTEKKEEKQS